MSNDTPLSLSDPSRWVELHGDYLFRFTLMRVRTKEAAEDIVQDTLIAALKARANFSGESTERTWLTGILKHKIIDYFRVQQKEAVSLESELTDERMLDEFRDQQPFKGWWRHNQVPGKWRIDLEDAVELAEFNRFVQKCLEGLDERYARIFLQKDIDQVPSEQICNDLMISATNLRVLLYRSRMQMRRCLERTWIGGSGGRPEKSAG